MIGLEPDRTLIGRIGRHQIAGSRQQPGARGPIRLILGQPRIVGERIER